MAETSEKSLTAKEFTLFRELIYKEAGISLGPSKQQLVESRLSKRLRQLNLSSFTEYYNYVDKKDADGSERLKLINSLTTNKTDFFREEHHFQYLRENVFPLLERRARETGDRKIRIWSAACSTGEEPYTLAMTVLDHFGPNALQSWDIKILASDVDTDVLEHARRGEYAADRVADVPKEVLKRHFQKVSRDPNSAVQVNPRLQELIAFRRINFIEPEWPIHTAFDIIFCRNVMIYFDEKTQDRLLTRFSDQLQPEGHLFIGHSESILRLDHLYRSLGHTIYRMTPGVGAGFSKQSPAAQSAQAAPQPSAAPRRVTEKKATARLAEAQSTDVRPRSARRSAPAQLPPDPMKAATGCTEPVPPTASIIVGEVKASSTPLKVTTLVGSCIAVCLYDPLTRIGGMNHFMLPCNDTNSAVCATYGIHAMELLINNIMKLGGDRRRLCAKVFGGGNVLGKENVQDTVWAIGERNCKFAFDFLKTDDIPIVAQDVGGTCGRQIQFLTHTGQAFIRPLEKIAEEIDPPPRRRNRSTQRVAPEMASPVLF